MAKKSNERKSPLVYRFTELRELTAKKASPEELKRLCDERDFGVFPANRGA